MGKVVSSVFGSAPKASTKAIDETKKAKVDTSKLRDALLSTEGGIQGQELTPEQTEGRPTLFGN